MNKDKITVLRNEFTVVIDDMDEQSLNDETVVKKALELEEKLRQYIPINENE